MKTHRHWRCGSCGWAMDLRQAATSVTLPVHFVPGSLPRIACPGLVPVAWTTALGYALTYVCRQSSEGVLLSEWVNTADMRYWTGATRADLAVALSYARRWIPDGFHEGELPKPATPKGLFG